MTLAVQLLKAHSHRRDLSELNWTYSELRTASPIQLRSVYSWRWEQAL